MPAVFCFMGAGIQNALPVVRDGGTTEPSGFQCREHGLMGRISANRFKSGS